MKSDKSRLIFFGNERLATGVTTQTPVLRSLVNSGYDVAAVVTNYEQATSRNQRELEIASVAHAYHLPLLVPKKLSDIKNQLADFGADVGVLVAYGKIIPASIIELFPKGIVNIHPSLLPFHRGPTPIESVILAGEKETGVSLMKLAPAMDAGPVYAQEKFVLSGNETKQQLCDDLSLLGSELLLRHLDKIINGEIKPTPQNESLATYDQLIHKDDSEIDWKKPAEQIEKEVRAYANWPKSRTVLAGKDVIITSSEVADEIGEPGYVLHKNKELIVACGQKSLKIHSLIPAGKKEMSGQAFLAGHSNKLAE